MDNQLNEENLQLAFNFDASDGSLTKNRIVGEILIEESNKRIAIQESSDKIAIDLGYSIDGDMEDMEFSLDSEKLLMKRVGQKWELIEATIKENQVVIVSDDPNFKTCLWLNKSSIGKTLNYKIISQNTSISSWMLDIIARKLNKFDIDDILSIKESVAGINTSITTANENITNLSTDVITVNENIENINTSITTLNNDVTELQNSTGSGGTVPAGYAPLSEKVYIGQIHDWWDTTTTTFRSNGTALVRTVFNYFYDFPYIIDPLDSTYFTTTAPVKLGKIISITITDVDNTKQGVFCLSLNAVSSHENNDPDYGGLYLHIRNITNENQDAENHKWNITFECEMTDTEEYVSDYDYIL